ncbi:hypothetical protein EPA93_09180 [Ktedonosporobacter rubrisoli]|uniref:HTH luxR-type domain-containing protein n=1 Tax=Ktedonosporobacter rubrisoli TaxID=2509675 RepID=A0A4V0YYG8_KTERU|nr:LuxR C-terminal-related transcriptional regulator [Ktedonosporobacter rubrisoli]QBD76171.1 hypothetical protein EPA93_09180 [Ktedonosporobacter rubrisoli]
MTRATPTIRETMLVGYEEGQAISLVVGSEQWFSWLGKDTTTIFAVQAPYGSYTARKESAGNRRGGWYWKAYRTFQGRLYRAYLGKSEDLTLARLGETALVLSTRIQGQAVQAASQALASPHPDPQSGPDHLVPPLLSSKLQPPQLASGLIERPHLLARLANCHTYKLSLLVAPAGFGKSTLVNQWLTLQQGTLPALMTAWVSLEPGDNDIFRFWHAVMTACQKLLGKPSQALGQIALTAITASITSSVGRPVERPPLNMALTHMLNALANPSSGGLLVLDDYHVISETRLHETLTFFIDHLPTNVHILLLSRAEPNLPLLRWRARGELYEMHGRELRFSLSETAAFLSQSLPQPPTEAALRKLDSSLEGWAAGLRLLSLTLSAPDTNLALEQALLKPEHWTDLSNRPPAQIQDPRHMLFAYLVSEILETQPASMQNFLLRTSILSRLCAPLCAAVSAEDIDGALLLEAASRAGLFLEALNGTGGWYRYHALFAEAMRREASYRLGEEVLQSLSAKASAWYEQEGMLAEAIEAAWLARDIERAARLIEQFHEHNFGSPQSMLGWLEQLPAAVLDAHPLLCFLFATELRFPVKLWVAADALLAAELTAILPESADRRVETLLSMAEEGWRKRGELFWLGAIWGHRALSALLDQEPFASIVNFAQQALAFLPPSGPLNPGLQMYRAACLYFVGRDKLSQGLFAEARQLLLQALTDNVPPGNKFLAVDILLTLGKAYLALGEQEAAKKYFQQALLDARWLGDEVVSAEAQLSLATLADTTRQVEPLSAQEKRVLSLIATGRSNQEIAHEMIISINTVKYHIKHIYQKLGVSNRLQASEAAHTLHLK